ncbi:MAG: FAD-dependent oxidoreductase [Actinomycetota bacterium]|nr:FAD-dependent oxidoreductase [Actinomycetota bacterium]
MTDLEYFDLNIPCQAACPVHTNAGAYVAAIADGDDRMAYLTARLPNPFASVCGRVCAAPCEDACRRGEIDRPVAIRALKRFVTETFGAEARGKSLWSISENGHRDERPQSVAIVGGGPGGLAAAHDLRLLGYRVTLHEASSELGGMMRLGIPEYRLPRELLDREIQGIVELGIDVHLGSRLGEDVSLRTLRESHNAVFLAIGATQARDLDIPGHDADGVFKALEFLLNVNRGFHVDVGERVVVVGGGNVAMDAARTALRSAAYREKVESEFTESVVKDEQSGYAIDVARSALRAGATDVTIISLEARDEMPADDFEIEEAEAEGIRFVHRRGPQAVLTEAGQVSALMTVGVTRVFDAEGRFSPEFDAEDVETVEADSVILAIGQAIDIESLGEDGPEISPRRSIAVDAETLRTSLPDVWAGGDAAFGPRILIDAVADGRRAAASIHAFLSPDDPTTAHRPGSMTEIEGFHRLSDRYDEWERVPIPSLPTQRRIGLQEVETGFTEAEARLEASRCLRCFLNITLDVGSCVLCGLCADVCPTDVISLVPSEELNGQPGKTALLLDESRCIRCALCVERCPSRALSMGMWSGFGIPEKVPVLIGGPA